MLEAQQGQSPPISPPLMRGLVIAANQQPELAGVFSTYAADTPQIYLDIDRNKAQVLGVKVSDVFTALQATLGGFYVNDFNLFGRTWQVNIQAETRLPQLRRRHLPDLCAQQRGAMVPIRAIAEAAWSRARRLSSATTAFRAAMINGAARSPASVRARRSRRWNASRPRTLPPGYGFEWTGTALRKRRRAARRGIVLGLAVLFAYLFLVALYESWNIPLPVLLSVSVGVLGAIAAWRSPASPSTSMPRSAWSCWWRSPPRTAS